MSNILTEILLEVAREYHFEGSAYDKNGKTDTWEANKDVLEPALAKIEEHYISKSDVLAAIGEDEDEFRNKRFRRYSDSATEQLWDLANGIEPISTSEFSTWGSSANAQYRKFALKLRNLIWKSNEESRNELRKEIRTKLNIKEGK